MFDTILGSGLSFQKFLISFLHSSIIPAFAHLLFYTLSIWLAVSLALSLWKLTRQKSGGTGLLTWHISFQTPFPSLHPLCPSAPFYTYSSCAPSSSYKSQHHLTHEHTPRYTHFTGLHFMLLFFLLPTKHPLFPSLHCPFCHYLVSSVRNKNSIC